MYSRVPMTLAGTLAGLICAGLAAAQQQDFSQIEFRTEPVADGIYLLQGTGGNIGVLTGPDGVILIDDEYTQLGDKLAAAVAAISDAPLRLVIDTHWHFDHTGGNAKLGREGAIIVAHENVRERMSKPFVFEFLGTEVPASPPEALPVVTFTDAVSLHLNGQTLSVMHVPNAHTDGDAIIFFEPANVVHMGDTFFNGFYPFIDYQSGGGIRGMVAAIDRALPKIDADTRIIPGHGPLARRAELVEFRDMLHTVARRLQGMLDDGMSTEQIIAAKPTAEFDGKWGGGFLPPDRWVDLVLRGMR